MRLRCANSLISFELREGRFVYKKKNIWGFKSIRIRLSAITYNKNFRKFSLFLFFTIRFTFKGVGKNESWLSDTHSQSFMGRFATLLTSSPKPPLPLPPPSVPGEKKRGYALVPNLVWWLYLVCMYPYSLVSTPSWTGMHPSSVTDT